MSGWRSYLTPAPLEVLKLGDVPIEEGVSYFQPLLFVSLRDIRIADRVGNRSADYRDLAGLLR